MDHFPKTLFIVGVVVEKKDCDSLAVLSFDTNTDIKLKVPISDKFYGKITIGKRYLVVYKDSSPCKIIALWNNPSAKKILTTDNEIRKFGSIIQNGKVRRG